MNKYQSMLVCADNGREAVMRLPVNKYGGITTKGYKLIRERFYDGATDTTHHLKYALNLEAFTGSEALWEALSRYRRKIL